MGITEVINVPKYADDCEYIVVRYEGDKAWFWGGYDSLKKAMSAAKNIDGEVLDQWRRAN